MPSATAQKRLILETYARAGLDLTKAEDRCQFFEAHGTGTPVVSSIFVMRRLEDKIVFSNSFSRLRFHADTPRMVLNRAIHSKLRL